MSLARWYQRRNVPTLWDQMDSIARDMARIMPWTVESEDHPLGVPVDVYETATDVVVKAEVPGVEKENIDVTIQENTLVIKGEVKSESEVNEEGYYRRELRTGSFYRAIPLPVEVNADEMVAKYENGVLTVRAPKAEKKQVGKRINIE